MQIEQVPVLWIPGGSWGICQRCAFKKRLNALSLEWSGLRVCEDCWDPRPVQLSPPDVYPEGVPRPDASPDTPNVFVNQNLGPEDL